MEFHAYHGCLEHEKQLGNTFLVTVAMELDTTEAAKTDKLSNTLNYQLIYDIIKEQMNIRANLLEHLAQRITDTLLHRFPEILSIQLKLSKLNPPLGGKVNSVSVETTKKNNADNT